jgi:hypothetical protein
MAFRFCLNLLSGDRHFWPVKLGAMAHHLQNRQGRISRLAGFENAVDVLSVLVLLRVHLLPPSEIAGAFSPGCCSRVPSALIALICDATAALVRPKILAMSAALHSFAAPTLITSLSKSVINFPRAIRSFLAVRGIRVYK